MKPHSPADSDDITTLQMVMRLIDDRLEDVFTAVPVRHRPLITNALLNLAVDRMLAGETSASAATILHRLADLIDAGKRPEGSDAFRLTGHDA